MTTFEDIIRDEVCDLSLKYFTKDMLMNMEVEEDYCEFFKISNICKNIEINSIDLNYSYENGIELIEFNGSDYEYLTKDLLTCAIIKEMNKAVKSYGYRYCIGCGFEECNCSEEIRNV